MDGISDIEQNSVKNGSNEEFVRRKSSYEMREIISPTSPDNPFYTERQKKEPIGKTLPKIDSIQSASLTSQKFFESQTSPKEKLRPQPLTATLDLQEMESTPIATDRVNINRERTLN